MKFVKLAAIAAAGLMTAAPAMAELVIPSLSYRTGAYAPSGIPFADGFADYFTLLNERDGGINGEPIKLIECETGYNTQKGVECYESTKGEGALVYHPLSTGITYQLIPKASADGIPVHSMGYGRTSAADGATFEWIFNYPGTYWDAASIIVKHMMDESGGSLQGKKIALVYHNSAYGKEPIRTLEELSKKHGFELSLLPVDHPGQEQKSQWLQIRRERPDFVTMWGWGVMNSVAIKEASNIRYPMEQFIGVWWSGAEADVIPGGKGADGYKAITFHNTGTGFPIYGDLQKHVVEGGKAAGAADQLGTVGYNKGLYAAATVSQAIKKAQEIHGVMAITPAQMRDGMEALSISLDDWKSLGLENFAPALNVTCANHAGPSLGAIQQWDADSGTWSLITDFVGADRDIVDPLIAEDAAAYRAEFNITPRVCK
jgi:branched-chain amino acid transport system substrate-binding protein